MPIAEENITQLIRDKNKASHTITLTFEAQTHRVFTDSPRIIEKISNLDPFIVKTDKAKHPLFSIYSLTQTIPSALIERIQEKGRRVAVDQSLYQATSSEGIRYDLESGKFFVFILKTHTLFYFLPQDRSVYIFHPNESSLSIETIRLLKSFISIYAESQGQLMLHASGIVTSNGATLLMGDSRNGKTTVLLDALKNFNADMLSCDTSFLRIENDELKVRGWPSNFSVSVGTMYDYECLNDLIPSQFRNLTYQSALEIYDKYVVDTKDVIKNIGVQIIPESTVNSIVALNFNPEAKTEQIPLKTKDAIHSWIRKVYLGSRDTLYPNWHQFISVTEEDIDTNIEQIAEFILKKEISFYQMNWAPAVQTLLRRVPALDSFHKLHIKTKG